LVSKKAFTLIEVMVAVMIVSVVIGALLKMQGNTNHLFLKMKQMQDSSHFATFLLWNPDYGLSSEKTNLYRLVSEFDLDDDVRRYLKSVAIELSYDKIETIESDDVSFEIGKSEMKSEDFDIALHRIRQP
jgi:prepilin-type N-terminal cleavage/methylation domain-containing protein